MTHYLDAFRRYVDFRGRASRTQYWSFVLFHVLVYGGLVVLAAAVSERLIAVASLYFFGSLVPGAAIVTRRLHDGEHSGWWQLVVFVPFGVIALLVLLFVPGTNGPNRFGPDPRAAVEAPVPNPWSGDQESRW